MSVLPNESGEPAVSPLGGITQQAKQLRYGLWIVLCLSAILFGITYWIRKTFGAINFDQLLMNTPGLGGGGITQAVAGYVGSFVIQAILVPLAVVAVLFVLFVVVQRRQARRQNKPPEGGMDAENADKSFVPRSTPRKKTRLFAARLSAGCVLMLSILMLSHTVGLEKYVRSMVSAQNMADYYVVPTEEGQIRSAALEPDEMSEPTNLITIFLESADDLLSDTNLFGENLYAELDSVTAGWESIDTLRTYEGGGWTMAGIVGTQCGVPLRGAGLGVNDINSNNIGAEETLFMPGATCVGDVLSAAGYTNVYLGGADESFASKGDFFRSHGYNTVKGLTYWQETGYQELGPWGLSDGDLMHYAKAQVDELYAANEPFNLTLLTLDFHDPAYFHNYCSTSDAEPLNEILRCSVRQVADFVSYLEASGYLANTAVVIMADHPKMLAEGGAYWDEMGALLQHERPLFNRVWSPTGLRVQQHDVDQLSMYATMLDLVSMGREDRQAGLGVSVFSGEKNADSAVALLPDEYNNLLQSRSANFYRDLWQSQDSHSALSDS